MIISSWFLEVLGNLIPKSFKYSIGRKHGFDLKNDSNQTLNFKSVLKKSPHILSKEIFRSLSNQDTTAVEGRCSRI